MFANFSCVYLCLQMSSVTMEATTMLPILKKKLAFLSGKTRVPTRGSSLWQLSNLHLHAVSSVIRFRSSTLSVCLSAGGKDRRSGLILTIPLCSDQTSMEELSATLDYLLSIPRYKHSLTLHVCAQWCKSSLFSLIFNAFRHIWTTCHWWASGFAVCILERIQYV